MKKLLSLSTKAPKKFQKEKIKKLIPELSEEISYFQKILYAQSKYSLLVILQGLDAAGKDGLISTVFHGVNPLGCDVKSFKAPTKEELSYDFLWRVHKAVPPKGQIYIFNRSHYEDVLVPPVEGWIDKAELKNRFDHINNFEKLLQDNGTVILKFYLHVSKKEQKKRLKERKTNPKKFWKHNDGDWETVKKFDHYLEAYEEIFKQCKAPEWNIIPSDQNWYKEYLVAKKIKETLAEMKLEYPGLEE
ncbi:MAG: polyphosphate kinase [Sporocytophaga sp.]|nr:polyphosphate kinase [Sporocytophaga sp.]